MADKTSEQNTGERLKWSWLKAARSNIWNREGACSNTMELCIMRDSVSINPTAENSIVLSPFITSVVYEWEGANTSHVSGMSLLLYCSDWITRHIHNEFTHTMEHLFGFNVFCTRLVLIVATYQFNLSLFNSMILI